MKKLIDVFCILLLVVTVSLTGCSSNNPLSENEVKAELQNYDIYPFNLETQPSISNFSVTKRKTDNSNGVDTIFLDVESENNDARFIQSYVMYYTLYNEGWLLDAVEVADAHNELIPLREPNNEEIESVFLSYQDRTGYECESWEKIEQTLDYEKNLCTVQFENIVIEFNVSGVEGHWRGVSATVRYCMNEAGTWVAIDNLEAVY